MFLLKKKYLKGLSIRFFSTFAADFSYVTNRFFSVSNYYFSVL